MPAIPIIGLGVSAATSLYGAHKQGQAADAQMQMMRQQSSLANQMESFGKGQISMSQPALQKAMSYYTNLASGDRGAISATLAPDVAQTNEVYRGAERGMENKIAAGPTRDRAIADMYRQRAGQLGMMPFQARNSAVGSMAQMGTQAADRAMRSYEGAGNALSGAANTARGAAETQAGASDRYGAAAGSLTQAGMQAWDWYHKSHGSTPFWDEKMPGGGPGGNVPWMGF